MSDRNGTDAEEWLTITACSKRLALHERQVRRYAGRLKDTDRTPPGQTPLRVRVSAILAEKDRRVSADVRVASEVEEQKPGQDTQDTVRSESGFSLQQIATIYEAQMQTKDAVIEAKDALIAVLSELSEERRQEIVRLQEENRRLLTAGAAESVGPGEMVSKPSGLSEAAGNGTERSPRRWWQVWKRGSV